MPTRIIEEKEAIKNWTIIANIIVFSLVIDLSSLFSRARNPLIEAFLSHSGYRGFGLKRDMFEKVTKPQKKRIEKSRDKNRRILNKMFVKKKNVIFLTHDVPYKFKFDKIKNPQSPLNGKHIGDEIYREIILKYKPTLHICGHMHEHQGKAKIGKTTVILPGFAHVGQAAIIDLPERKVKFIKL